MFSEAPDTPVVRLLISAFCAICMDFHIFVSLAVSAMKDGFRSVVAFAQDCPQGTLSFFMVCACVCGPARALA